MNTAETPPQQPSEDMAQPPEAVDFIAKLSLAKGVESDVVRERLIKNSLMTDEGRAQRREVIIDKHRRRTIDDGMKHELLVRTKLRNMRLGRELGEFATKASKSI